MLHSAFQYNLKRTEEDIHNRNKITLNVDDMESQVLEATLKFIYKGNLDDMTDESEWNTELAAGLLTASKRFVLFGLQKYCLAKLAAELTLKNVGRSAILAYEFYATQPVVHRIHQFIKR